MGAVQLSAKGAGFDQRPFPLHSQKACKGTAETEASKMQMFIPELNAAEIRGAQVAMSPGSWLCMWSRERPDSVESHLGEKLGCQCTCPGPPGRMLGSRPEAPMPHDQRREQVAAIGNFKCPNWQGRTGVLSRPWQPCPTHAD